MNTLTRLSLSLAGMVCQPLLTLLLVGFLCSTPWTFGDEEVEADNGNIQKNNFLYNELCKTRVLFGLEECVIRV